MLADSFGRICGEIWNITHQDCPVVDWEWPCHYPPDSGELEAPLRKEDVVEAWGAKLWPVYTVPGFDRWPVPVPDYRRELEMLLDDALDYLDEDGIDLELHRPERGRCVAYVLNGAKSRLLGFGRADSLGSAVVLAVHQALCAIREEQDGTERSD